MDLIEEYRMQAGWRNWESYITCLPIKANDVIYDLGCSLGFVSKILSNQAAMVYSIDNNQDLLNEAQKINPASNIIYKTGELRNIELLELPLADGIWSSFVAAYFPDFTPILKKWAKLLKPGGWIALVEMSGLYSHEPLNHFVNEIFRNYSDRQRINNVYDFEMGKQVKQMMIDCGLSIIHEEEKTDRELNFIGPAEAEILKAWETRFNRMSAFRDYVGEENFQKIKSEFLLCLKSGNHCSKTVVKFLVAKK